MFDGIFAFEMSSNNYSKAGTNPSDSEQTSHVGALYLNRLLSAFSVGSACWHCLDFSTPEETMENTRASVEDKNNLTQKSRNFKEI